jgi:hypothetical protein
LVICKAEGLVIIAQSFWETPASEISSDSENSGKSIVGGNTLGASTVELKESFNNNNQSRSEFPALSAPRTPSDEMEAAKNNNDDQPWFSSKRTYPWFTAH